MSERRADLIVPGPEGGWLARALEQAGVHVRRRELGEPIAAQPAVIVVSLSLEAGLSPRASFERQLAQAREGALPDTPLVALLPVDAQLDDDLRELAQGVYVRPVPVARLVHRIGALLDAAEGRTPRPSWVPSVPPVPRAEEPVVRERTVRLDAARRETSSAASPAAEALSASASATRRRSRTPSGPLSVVAEPSSQVSGLIENTQPVAELSPWLHRMLSDCDRRMFPAAPPLDLRFPAGDEGPLQLVPRALLDVLGVPVDPAPGLSYDEHTFLAGLHAEPGSLKRHREWPRLESSVGGTGSTPGRPRSVPGVNGVESADGAESGEGTDASVGPPQPSPATREVVLPVAPRVPEGSAHVSAESVAARRPDDDTRRARRQAHRRESAPPAGDGGRRSSAPAAPSRSSQAPLSSPPPPSVAGLYETAVEVGGFAQPPPGFARPAAVTLGLGTPTSDGRGRWGALAPESWMPFAESLSALPGERRVSLRSDRATALLHIRDGQVFVPLAAARPAQAQAPGAAAGPLASWHDLRRAQHVAREHVLMALTPAAPDAEEAGRLRLEAQRGPEVVFAVYDVSPGDELQEGWAVGGLDALMFEALVGWVTAEWLRARWHDDLARVVRLERDALPRATRAGVDPLWLDWLRAHGHLPLDALLSTLPPSEGLPAVLLALESLDAVTLHEAPAAPAALAPLALQTAARRVIEAAYAATRDADYFTVLGVGSVTTARAIERACAAASATLTQLDLDTLDLLELEPLRRDVLDCYAEAARALRDDTTRARYARALGLSAAV